MTRWVQSCTLTLCRSAVRSSRGSIHHPFNIKEKIHSGSSSAARTCYDDEAQRQMLLRRDAFVAVKRAPLASSQGFATRAPSKISSRADTGFPGRCHRRSCRLCIRRNSGVFLDSRAMDPSRSQVASHVPTLFFPSCFRPALCNSLPGRKRNSPETAYGLGDRPDYQSGLGCSTPPLRLLVPSTRGRIF